MTLSPELGTVSTLLGMIEAKYHARGQANSFNQAQRILFGEILENLPQPLALAAVRRMLLFSSSFVPDPAELLLTAAQLASPMPDEDSAWREVFDRMGAVRPKPLSHSQILETVRDLGGYETLWHQYQFARTPVGVIRAQFLEAYKRRRARWETAVRETLLRPHHAWDWTILPPTNPLLCESTPQLPAGDRHQPALNPPPRDQTSHAEPSPRRALTARE